MVAEAANFKQALSSLDDDEDAFQEEDAQYNFRELMDEVSKLGDAIITIPAEELAALKAGLITRKSKDNAKLKAAGLLPDNLVLAFLAYPAKDGNGAEIPDVLDVRVKLRPKKSVTVLKICAPGDL